MADHFGVSQEEPQGVDHNVVLMRGHGMSVVAPDIKSCVLRSYYTKENAAIQSTVLVTNAAYYGVNATTPRYLNSEEAADATGMTIWSADKPWDLWVREVERSNLYLNEA